MSVTTTVSNGLTSSNQTSLTIAHTSDANPLYVLLSWYVGGGGLEDTSIVTGVTFNGVALTRFGHAAVPGQTMEAWRLAAPAATSANVVITASAARRITAGVLNLSGWPSSLGAHTFAAAGDYAVTAQPSVTVSSKDTAEVIDWLGVNHSSQAATPGSGQSSLWSNVGTGGGVGVNHDQESAGSLKAGAAGSVLMSWTLSQTDDFWGLAAISFTDQVAISIPTTAGPQTPCAPQSQLDNGGKGKFGCNNGGEGWTSSYSGPYGTVPQHEDPSEGEALTGKEHAGVEAWIRFYHRDYPSGVVTMIQRAMVELADAPAYEFGRKPEGLLSVGDIEHALGNEQGGFEAATVAIGLTDAIDRAFRVLLEDQELEGDEVMVLMASDAARGAF